MIARLLEAYEHKQNKNYLAAVNCYKELYSNLRKPLVAEAIANCYVALGENEDSISSYKEAAGWFEEAHKLNRTNPNILFELGKLYYVHLIEYDKALSAFTRALNINPNHEGALVLAAAMYWHPESSVTLEKAIHWQERLVDLNPAKASHFAGLASLYKEASQKEDFEDAWAMALTRKELVEGLSVSEIKEIIEEG